MSFPVRHARLVTLLIVPILLVACTPAAVSPAPTTVASQSASVAPIVTASPAMVSPSIDVTPSASVVDVPASPSGDLGAFAFTADDITNYYTGTDQNLVCAAPKNDTRVGYSLTVCDKTVGTLRYGIAVVTADVDGSLADGFAFVTDTTKKAVAPTTAAKHLAGFLGALLGPDNGVAPAQWMATNLGAEYKEEAVGSATVATFNGTNNDPSSLYVEVASARYLAAAKR
jgi:hypothetical protein